MSEQRARLILVPLVLGVAGFAAWAAPDFAPGDSFPGYVHRNGAGSRVDVRTDGTHDGTGWTVVFTRSLRTGDAAHDVQFAPGGLFDFQVAKWDNAGDELHDTSDAGVVYQMLVPNAPGPVTFLPGVPSIFTDLTGEYLASEEIRITARWADPTKNDQRKRWTFDGTEWSQSSDNEDRVAFLWDMVGDDFATTGTCVQMCHTPFMYTAAGVLDAWQWKATRTNPSGYADDKYWDDGAAGTASGRHSDPGSAPYLDNKAGSPPTYMAEDDPGAGATFLFEFPEGTKEAVPYAAGAWKAGDVLPGYVHRRGSGSRVDVRSTGTHDGTGWTVTFRRKLDTGDAKGDIAFATGGTYSFQVTTWDNAGDEAHDVSESGNVYQMTIPAAPGFLTFSATPALLTSLTGALLPSGEIEITATWNDATRNDVRKQWSHDGAAWSRSSQNEDRIAFIWDMQNDGFASAGTCAAMCHPPDMYTAPGTFVDTWHWKASRTGPTGFSEDKYWDDGALGTGSGRHSDLGTSVYEENADAGGSPTHMSSAGAGTSARFLFEHAPASGWSRSIRFAVPSVVARGRLKVNFKKPARDSLKLSGTYQAALPPGLVDGLTGTFEAGTLTRAFAIGAKGKSAKDPNLKVKITERKSKWSVRLKKSDLQAALSTKNATIPKPGEVLEIEWKLSLSNGWTISGKVTLTYTAKAGKSGKGKL